MPIAVFISSKIYGMTEERDSAERIINEHKFIADRSENWPADQHHTGDVCERQVRLCDAVVFIFGRAYSEMTECEYEEAIRSKKPRLVFIQDTDEREEEMENFLSRIGDNDGRFRANYNDIEDLEKCIDVALSNLVMDKFQNNKERSIIERAKLQCDNINDYLLEPRFLPQSNVTNAVNISDVKLDLIRQKREIEKILGE